MSPVYPVLTGLIALIVFNLGQAAPPTERLIWDKHPIQLTLPVGKERLVTFPTPVRVGIPGSLSDQLTTQSLDGTVYWTATAPFTTTRVQVQSVHDNQLYLIDLSATHDSAVSDVKIVTSNQSPGQSTIGDTAIANTSQSSVPHHQSNSRLDLIALTRHAAQQLYAPRRLLAANPNLHRVRVSATPTQHLIRGQSIEATPVAAWRKGRLYVTAFQLRNLSTTPATLDPQSVRGDWQAATFQHDTLNAAGTVEDTTAVYLIADHPYRARPIRHGQ